MNVSLCNLIRQEKYFSEVFDQTGNNKVKNVNSVLINVNQTATCLNLCVIVERK